MSNLEAILETNFLELGVPKRGKVRDIYEFDEELLMVATDRISVFDGVLPTAIPGKGKILTMLTIFWFEYLRDIVRNHLITSQVEDFPEPCKKYSSFLEGRSLLVRKHKPLPVEFIVRRYLSGSAWKEYKKSQSVCGIKLPSGLKESDKLPEAIFTPSTKAEMGEHDINLSFEEYVNILEKRLNPNLGKHIALLLKTKSVELYNKASTHALSKNTIIADTKFEFAVDENDNIVLIDEVLTPDSSRFWPKDKYEPGRPQESLDKQFVRNYLEGWDKKPPAPELPDYIVEQTQKKYGEILKLIV